MPTSPIVHALITAAYRLSNGSIPQDQRLPVDPELDCMTQALHETCQVHGMGEDQIARFLLSFAIRFGQLQPEISKRLALRELEERLLASLGQAEPRLRETG